MAKNKTAAPQFEIPHDDAEAAHMLAELGREQRIVESFERSMNDRMTQMREDCDRHVKPHNERIEALFGGLCAYATVHRQRLCADGGKSHRMPTGWLRWRMTPPSVKLTGEKAVLAQLCALGLDKYVAEKKSVNKSAILDDPAGVADIEGISIVQREEFVAEPDEDEIAQPSIKARGEEVQG